MPHIFAYFTLGLGLFQRVRAGHVHTVSALLAQIRIEDIGPHAQCDLGIYLLPRDNALVPEDGRSHGLKSSGVTICRLDHVVELDLGSGHDTRIRSMTHLGIVGDAEKQDKGGGPLCRNDLDVLVESNLYRYGLPGRIARADTGSRDHVGSRGLSGHVYPVAGLDFDCLMSHLGVRVVRDLPDRSAIENQAVRPHAYPVLVKVARPHRVREHKRSRRAVVRVVLGLAVTLHESVAGVQGVYPEDHAGVARNRDRLRERYSNLYLIVHGVLCIPRPDQR